MFILFTSTNFPTGGAAATYLNLFCKGVKENGGEIKVYLFKGYVHKKDKKNKNKKNITESGVKYTFFASTNRPENKFLKILEDAFTIIQVTAFMLRLTFIRKKITILVYSNEFPFNLPIYLLSKLFFIKIVSFVPEFYDKKELQSMGRFKIFTWYSFLLNYTILNKLSNRIIVFSDFLKNDYIKKGYNKKNIIVQPNLTDLRDWYIPAQAIKYTIGYAGTPSKKDGIFELLSSIKILKDKGIFINAIIIGDSTGKESYLPSLKELCNNLNISAQINFTGFLSQQDVKKYLNECQILAVTRPNTKQTQAGFPTKLGEYLATGNPVVITNVGEITLFLKDEVNAYIAEPDSSKKFSEKLIEALSDQNRIKVGLEGQKLVYTEFNYLTQAKKLEELFMN